MSWTLIEQLFPYAIAYTIPLLMAGLGGLMSERSGVVNIGLEGLMVVGSFSAALTISMLQNNMLMSSSAAIWVGLLVAAICGGIFSLLHAVASVNLNANQIISGTAINMLAGALMVYLARNITGSGNINISSMQRATIPVLSDIPVIGPLLFRQTYATTWVALLVLVALAFLLYRMPFGLRLRACGENPQAADAAGVNVARMRYFGVVSSGVLAGLGGAIMLVTYSSEFNGTVGGLGFLALAALVFGQWKPLGVLGATLFFGVASTIANVSQAIPSLMAIPPFFLKSFPYILTLVAMIFFGRRTQGPKAAGEIYDKGKR